MTVLFLNQCSINCMPDNWVQSVFDWYASVPVHAACIVAFPGYRPDLVRTLSNGLNAVQIDFRAQCMAPLGWQATTLPLSAIDKTAVDAMQSGRDIVLQNVEALLASVAKEARVAWLANALEATWPQRLVLPLTLYAHEIREQADALLFDLASASLPEESLLERLPSLQ